MTTADAIRKNIINVNTTQDNTMMNTTPWYRQFWPWFLLILPLTVVVAGIITIIIAATNPPMLVAADYYKQGLSINRDLRSEKYSAALELVASLQVNQATNEIECRLNGNADFTPPNELILSLHHPADKQYDHTITLRQKQDGDYRDGHFYIGQLNDHSLHRWYITISPQIDNEQRSWLLRGVLPNREHNTNNAAIQIVLGYPDNQAPHPMPTQNTKQVM